MAAYCFFDILEFTDPAKVEQYREGVFSTVEKYDGRYLVLGGQCETVEGTWCPTVPVMIEFPSLAQARRWYESEEYRPLRQLRVDGTRGHAVFIEGI